MDPDRNKNSSKTLAWRLMVAVLFALPSLAAGWVFYQYACQTIHIAFAHEQTAIFEEMREKCLRANTPSEAARHLDYATNYYPSGTKQDKGSRLDEIVERGRRCAIRDMIAHLRTQTGQDLGDDPEVWIAKFTKSN